MTTLKNQIIYLNMLAGLFKYHHSFPTAPKIENFHVRVWFAAMNSLSYKNNFLDILLGFFLSEQN